MLIPRLLLRSSVCLMFLAQGRIPLLLVSSQTIGTTCNSQLKDNFRMVMNTDQKPTETSFKIFVRENGKFAREVFKKKYSSTVINDITNNCMFRNYCFKLVVYDSAGDGLCCEHGNGSYEAFWNGVRLKDDPFLDGSESISFFGDCESEPSSVPVTIPTVSPKPTPIGGSISCNNTLKDNFRLVMNTDRKPTETSFKIFVHENGKFARVVFQKKYSSTVINDITNNCMFRNYCFKLVVYDSAGDGLCCEHGNGSYQAFWNGERFKEDQFTNGSESISFFGNCNDEPSPDLPCTSAHKDQVEVLINSDARANDNYFRIFRMSQSGTNLVEVRPVMTVWQLKLNTVNQRYKKCLPTSHCYKAVLFDTEGDGICCEHGQGSYELRWNGELIKADKFMEGGESTTLFGNCPTLSPSISASPIASEMPSNAPIISVAPSSRPSERHCSATQEKFRMFMTPDSTNPSDVSFEVKLYTNGAYSRIIHSFDKYSNDSANQRNVRCLRYNSCFKVIVRSKAGTGIGTGSFSAYWKGVKVNFPDASFTSGSSSESEYFGRLSECPP